MILELILISSVTKMDPFCLKVPAAAWKWPVATVLQTAEITYGVKEPELSRLKACILKPMPRAK